jgi:hypothetical protein
MECYCAGYIIWSKPIHFSAVAADKICLFDGYSLGKLNRKKHAFKHQTDNDKWWCFFFMYTRFRKKTNTIFNLRQRSIRCVRIGYTGSRNLETFLIHDLSPGFKLD